VKSDRVKSMSSVASVPNRAARGRIKPDIIRPKTSRLPNRIRSMVISEYPLPHELALGEPVNHLYLPVGS
jgi:hypothetical protein